MKKKYSYMHTVNTKLLTPLQRKAFHNSIKEQQEHLSGPNQRSPVDFGLPGFPDAPQGQSTVLHPDMLMLESET